MAQGIFLPNGTFQPFDVTDLSTELATHDSAGVVLSEIEGWLNVLPDPNPVLRKSCNA